MADGSQKEVTAKEKLPAGGWRFSAGGSELAGELVFVRKASDQSEKHFANFDRLADQGDEFVFSDEANLTRED